MDERLRELERRWLRSNGAPDDEAAWLAERERSGDPDPRRELMAQIVHAIDMRPRSILYTLFPRLTWSPRWPEFYPKLIARLIHLIQEVAAPGGVLVKTSISLPGQHAAATFRVVVIEPSDSASGRAWWVPADARSARALRGSHFRRSHLACCWDLVEPNLHGDRAVAAIESELQQPAPRGKPAITWRLVVERR